MKRTGKKYTTLKHALANIPPQIEGEPESAVETFLVLTRAIRPYRDEIEIELKQDFIYDLQDELEEMHRKVRNILE